MLIITGALENIIDHIFYGSVIDFLDFHLYGYHWPTFNVAKSAIVIGVMTLFIISYLEEKEKKIWNIVLYLFCYCFFLQLPQQ